MTTRKNAKICKPKYLFLVTKYPLPQSIELTYVTHALQSPSYRIEAG